MRQTRKATVREALGHKPAPDVVEAVFLNPRLQALREIIREAGEQFFVEAELAVDKFGLDLPAILTEMKKTLGVKI